MEDVMALSFGQQLELTLIDKCVIGGLLTLAAYVFSKALEAFKGTQSLELEAFRGNQSQELASFTQEQNRKLEEFKNQLTAESESRRNVRLAVAEVARRVAAATHSICWVTWSAKYAPKSFTLANLNKYNGEIHLLLSEIVGARVVLAALSPAMHGRLTPLIDELYNTDVEMGEAERLFREDPEKGLAALATLHAASGKLDAELLAAVAEMGAGAA
jgi:hypothetical protein